MTEQLLIDPDIYRYDEHVHSTDNKNVIDSVDTQTKHGSKYIQKV